MPAIMALLGILLALGATLDLYTVNTVYDLYQELPGGCYRH